MRRPSQNQYGPSEVCSTCGPRSRHASGRRDDHTSGAMAWMSRWSSAEIRIWSGGRDISRLQDGCPAYWRASIMATMPSRSAAPAPVARRDRGIQTRAEIVAAAERHFAERGFEATRLDDIAADVGIRRAAIFYHFGDKQELYTAVLDEILKGAAAALPSHGSTAERLEAALIGWVDYVAQRPNVARLILREAANARPGVASPLMRASTRPVELLREMIDEGVASGELRPRVDPHHFISLMGA